MSIIGIPIGFYGYLFPGNINLMVHFKLKIYTVKEIASELCYDDEYYFSRFFKVNADVSPQLYRDTVGFAKGMN